MKILHIVEDFSLNSGGLRTVVKNLDFYLKSEDIESYILSTKKEENDNIKTITSGKIWLYNKDWKKEILYYIKIKKIDIIHIHGVWLYPQYIAAKICSKKQIPFILTPHGMYEPWLWNQGTFKKKVYFNLVVFKYFSKAKYIHGITKDEIRNLKLLFLNNSFKEIPNLIPTKELKNISTIPSKYILYLGRLDRKKGIHILIEAFSKMSNMNFVLKIAGAFNEYKKELDTLIIDFDLKDRIEFLGLIKKDRKEKVLKNAWVMVAPSYSEVIGMVNLEAASLKTPVITTYQTGIKKEWKDNGGFLINPNVKELKMVLDQVTNWSQEERRIRGEKLFNFVKKEYSWEKRINDWKELYKITLKS